MASLRSLAAALLGLLLVAPAQAATVVDCSTSLYCDLGTLSGNTGATINSKATAILTGSLAAGTALTLEYHLTGSATKYSFYTTENLTAYLSNAVGNATASTDGTHSSTSSLLVATAVVSSAKKATITLTNLSSLAATGISALIHSLYALGDKAVTIKYTTAAVPLPASFYMFGLALAGMFYVGSRRKDAAKHS